MSRRLEFLRERWFLVCAGGLLLLLVASVPPILATHSHLVRSLPAVIIGAVLVPWTFVVYLRARLQPRLPARQVGLAFIGTAVAGLLLLLPQSALVLVVKSVLNLEMESATYALMPVLVLGEELTKLAIPVLLCARGRSPSMAAGLMIGVSSAAGFACMENVIFGIGYVGRADAWSKGIAVGLVALLVGRGVMAIATHIAYTGIVSTGLWRERNRMGRTMINITLVRTFLLVVLFHTLWNAVFLAMGSDPVLIGVGILGLAVLAAVSLVLLNRSIREAEQDTQGASVAQAADPAGGSGACARLAGVSSEPQLTGVAATEAEGDAPVSSGNDGV